MASASIPKRKLSFHFLKYTIMEKTSVLNKYVSLFENCTTATPTEDNIRLIDWLEIEFKEEVMKYRECKYQSLKKKRKKRFPAITPSGVFYPTRSSENLFGHSGLLCVDIDGKDNPHITDWEELKNRLSKISNVAYCGLSISGKGAFAIIPIAYPEYHRGHFNAIDLYFAHQEGLLIDTACKDICRLRTISYDPSPYFNHDAELFRPYIDYSNMKKTSSSKISDVDMEKIESILNEIKESSLDITSDYNEWFQIAYIISKVYGEDGREKFHEFSQYHSKYNAKECDYLYNACLKKEYNYTVGTLVYIRNQYR